MKKPIKVTLDVLGIPVKCVFKRESYGYVAKVPMTTARKIFATGREFILKNRYPLKNMDVTVGAETCITDQVYRRYVHIQRFTKGPSGEKEIFNMTISVYTGRFAHSTLTVNHKTFDWMFAERVQVANGATYLEHENPVLADEEKKLLACH